MKWTFALLAFIFVGGTAMAADNTVMMTANDASSTFPELWLNLVTTHAVINSSDPIKNILVMDRVLKHRNWNMSTTLNADGVTVSTVHFPNDGEVEGELRDCDYWDGASTSGARGAYLIIDGTITTPTPLFNLPPVTMAVANSRTAYSAPFVLTVTATSTLSIGLTQTSGLTFGPGCTDLRLRYTDMSTQPIRGAHVTNAIVPSASIPVRVQSTGTANGDSVTFIASTFSAPTGSASGTKLFAIYVNGGSQPTFVDNQSNAWTQWLKRSAGGVVTWLFVALNPTAGTTWVQANSGSGFNHSLALYEVSNLTNSTGTTTMTGSGGALNIVSDSTPSVSGQSTFYLCGIGDDAGSVRPFTQGSGFTLDVNMPRVASGIPIFSESAIRSDDVPCSGSLDLDGINWSLVGVAWR